MKLHVVLILVLISSEALSADSLDKWPTYGNGHALVLGQCESVKVTKGTESAPAEISINYQVLEVLSHRKNIRVGKLKKASVSQIIVPKDLLGGSTPLPIIALATKYAGRLAILPVVEKDGAFRVKANIVFDQWISFPTGAKDLVRRQELAAQRKIELIRSKESLKAAVAAFHDGATDSDALGHLYLNAGAELLKLVDSKEQQLQIVRTFVKIAFAEKAPLYVRKQALWKIRQVKLGAQQGDVWRIRIDYMSAWIQSVNCKEEDAELVMYMLYNFRDALTLAKANKIKVELRPKIGDSLKDCIVKMKDHKKPEFAGHISALAKELLKLTQE